MKITTRKITYNNKPDPITSIKEYKIDENGKRVLVKENTYDEKTGLVTMNDPVINPGTVLDKYSKKDKPQEGKIYALTGTRNDKCILNGNTWKESEVGENISDIQKRVSDRVGKVFDPKTDQYVSIKTKEDA